MKDFVFNELDLDSSIIENLKQYNEQIVLESPCWIPINVMDVLLNCKDLFKWFEYYQCIPSFCAVIKNSGNGHGSVHTDIDHRFSSISFNVGVQHGENSYTEIYEYSSGDSSVVYISESRAFQKYNECNLKLIGSYNLKKPVLLNTKYPHKIFNFGNKVRTTYSFRFKKDPIELMTKKIGP